MSAKDQSQQHGNNKRDLHGPNTLEHLTQLRLVFDTAALQGVAQPTSCVAENLLHHPARFGVGDALFLSVVMIDQL